MNIRQRAEVEDNDSLSLAFYLVHRYFLSRKIPIKEEKKEGKKEKKYR